MHRISNGWIRQAYVQGFYFQAVTLYQAINIFEIMKVAENIYEGVVDPS